MSDSPRRSRAAVRLAQLSPLLGFALVALVWFSVPPAIAPNLVDLAGAGGGPITASARTQWMGYEDDLRVSKQLGLSGDTASLDQVAGVAWTNWADSLGAHPTTESVLTPRVASADATAFAPIRGWERAYHARVWAWVTPLPPMPAVVASATGNTAALTQARAAYEQMLRGANASETPTAQGMVRWLWTDDASGGRTSVLPALGFDFVQLGGGGGSSGGAGYSVSAMTLASGEQLYRLVAVGPEITGDSSAGDVNLTVLAQLDPRAPGFATRISTFARKAKVNIWVLGPEQFRAIPLRIPEGATAEQASRLGLLVWPSVPVRMSFAPALPVALDGQSAALAGGHGGFVQIAGVNSTPYFSRGGPSLLGPTDPEPQTVAFLAVFDQLPSQPSGLTALWRDWQWLISAWFPFWLGGAVSLLAITLVASPVAFVSERRRIARERVREDMARLRRDAHDKVYNRLSALSKRVAVSGEKLAACNAAALGAIAEDIRTTVGELQTILGEEVQHTGGSLTSVTLADQIASVCAAQSARLAVDVECDTSGPLPQVDPQLGWDLQCIAEEAITNAVRHGGASRIRIQLIAHDELLELVVSDDGGGSPVLFADEAPAGSTGLRGMRDRLARHGGVLSLSSGPGTRGTVLRARVPMPSHRDSVSG